MTEDTFPSLTHLAAVTNAQPRVWAARVPFPHPARSPALPSSAAALVTAPQEPRSAGAEGRQLTGCRRVYSDVPFLSKNMKSLIK